MAGVRAENSAGHSPDLELIADRFGFIGELLTAVGQSTPARLRRKWLQYTRFRGQLRAFDRLRASSEERFSAGSPELLPCLTDATSTTAFDRHYTYHPAWAARVLARTRPAHHVDISSVLHFGTVLSAFIPVTFYDYRPPALELSGYTPGFADLLKLAFETGSQNSISCMHTVEHVGLGRYGDPLDYDGDLKAMAELERVLAPGGTLLFVVPVGSPRIVFNAHRIYSHAQILDAFKALELVEFALVPDKEAEGGLISPATAAQADAQTYGCGCFWFRKPG